MDVDPKNLNVEEIIIVIQMIAAMTVNNFDNTDNISGHLRIKSCPYIR